MLKLITGVLLILFSITLSAQEFGGNPPSQKWRMIDTDTARIIFPEGMENDGQRVATVVHFLAAKNNSLGAKLHKISIVLQNQSTIANGYVALGPFRSEFLMTPSFNNFDLGSNDWADGLASHEYRHVQQFNNFRVGLSNLMYYLSGEDGLTLAINASIPEWFYEGDAVYNETIYTKQGRGRLPFFMNQYKSLFVSGKKYSWMKLRNGSLKDYVPNHYPLGYMLVNYGNEKYGKDFWGKVTHDAASFKGLVYPFQKAIKTHAGVDFKTFRRDAFKFYNKLENTNGFKSFYKSGEEKITESRKDYVTTYLYPYQIGNDSILYLKSDYRHRNSFFIKDKDGDHRIRAKDISLDEQYGYRNGKIVYSAFETDPRWRWKDFGVITVLDIKTNTQVKLTSQSKYFSPDISEDGLKVVAVNYDPLGHCELHILDANSGDLIKKILPTDFKIFTDPKFYDNNSVIAAVRYQNSQMSLVKIDIASGSIEKLLPASYHVFGNPFAEGDKIYFTASYLGNDDLFYIDINSKKVKLISGSADFLGNYFPNVKDNILVYSHFTADGYQLEKRILPGTDEEINIDSLILNGKRLKVAKENEYADARINDLPTRNFQTDKYKKGTKLLNFHSWRPYYEDPIFTYTLYGQNVLNTLETQLYYSYNQDERTNSIGLSTIYGGWFPYVSAGTEYTFRRRDTLNNLTRQWDQLDTRIGLSIPLNFTSGRSFRFLNFGSNYVFRVENNTGPNKDVFPENNFSYLSHFISYSQQIQMARQQIFPRLGVGMSLQYRHAITKYDSYQFIGSANVYLPGFLSTHSIVLNSSFQQRDTFRVLFSNRFAYSRGYNEAYLSRMWKIGANYHFPIWLPDWGFGNILYIQRIRANAFYDFTKVYSRNKKSTLDQRSTGMEFYFDTKWWNQYPLTFGFRISKLLDNDLFTGQKETWIEFILPVSIIPK